MTMYSGVPNISVGLKFLENLIKVVEEKVGVVQYWLQQGQRNSSKSKSQTEANHSWLSKDHHIAHGIAEPPVWN